jgi:ABC-2 type transport system permease protein
MALFALLGSVLLFGQEDLVVFRETDLHIISQQDVIWRFFAAFVYAALALTMIAAMALLLSVYAENSLGPIVATVCIVIVFTILQQLKVPVFEQTINPWSFTTHMLGWKGFFYVEKDIEGATINGSIENPMALVKSGLILLGYTMLFVVVAVWGYRKKDILC